jgi:hypothetical protein
LNFVQISNYGPLLHSIHREGEENGTPLKKKRITRNQLLEKKDAPILKNGESF